MALRAWLLDWDPTTQGRNFHHNHMAVNVNFADFKLTIVEFNKGLYANTSANIIRYVTMCVGRYMFHGEVGMDLGHLMISIFMSGLILHVLTNKLRHCKHN